MRYFIDCEFDGHNGPLLSFAIVNEDGKNRYLIIGNEAKNPWVKENVIPVLENHKATFSRHIPENDLGAYLTDFIGFIKRPIIVADSPVDISRFTKAISTDSYGNYAPFAWHSMQFIVKNIDCYPTELEGAIQHNAWHDAMALRYKVLYGKTKH